MTDSFTPAGEPLIVAYGLGVDSTAMLVGLAARGIRPDLILFADTGSEKPETYAYLPIMQAWLASVGFPAIEVVRYVPQRATYRTLEENCLVNETLPSLAFGMKGCSLKWKREPQDRHVRRTFAPARDAWSRGLRCVKLIGYDNGPADSRRSKIAEDKEYTYRYPLREWGWDRERCKEEIARAGLPVPPKSACFFCPASKPHEIAALSADMQARIIAIEETAAPHIQCDVCLDCGKHGCRKHPGRRCSVSRAEHSTSQGHDYHAGIAGLWRKATGARPGDMTTYLRTLPAGPSEGSCGGDGECDGDDDNIAAEE